MGKDNFEKKPRRDAWSDTRQVLGRKIAENPELFNTDGKENDELVNQNDIKTKNLIHSPTNRDRANKVNVGIKSEKKRSLEDWSDAEDEGWEEKDLELEQPSGENEILEKVDKDMEKERVILKAKRLEKEKQKSLQMEQKEKEKELREVLKEKHGFTPLEFSDLIRNRQKFSNFFIISLIEYLEYQKETEFSFNKMTKFKKEENKEYYEIEKENWEELKNTLSTYQLNEKEAAEKIPGKITNEEETEVPYFIREHNLDLGALNQEYRQMLIEILKAENKKREEWDERTVVKSKKAA